MSRLALTAAAGAAGGAAADPFFNQNTLLLHGDGTNGAQNNTFLDSSTNTFTITRNGNTTQGTFSPFSLPNGEFSNFFDGSGDYINTSSTLIGTTATTFTIEAWIYMTATPVSTANIPGLCGDMEGGSGTNYMSFGPLADGTLGFQWYNASNITAIGNTVMALNTWNHIAVVVNSSAISLYVNGVAQSITGTTTITNRGGTTSKFTIGVNDTQAGFTGYASNIRVTSTAVYTSGFTPSTTPLTAITNTSLLTCQTNRFKDNSTNNFAITVNGTPSVQPFSPFLPSAAYSPSVNGGSGYFDGSGDYLTAAAGSSWALETGAFTVETWVYFQALPDYVVTVGTLKSGDVTTWAMEFLNTGDVRFRNWVAAQLTSGPGVAKQNMWMHIAVVRDGSSNGAIFVNGIRVANVASMTTNYSNSTDPLYIGRNNADIVNITGYMSGTRVIKGSAQYDPTQSSITVPTAPLTAVTNTQLLCNFTNAGIFDNTGKNNLETVADAQIDTTTKKYGTGSMEFDGTGDFLIMPYSQDFNFGTGDFTVECWANISYVQFTAIITSTNTLIVTPSWLLGYSNTPNEMAFGINSSGVAIVGADYTSYLNTWTHIAACRSGTTLRLFFNGTQVASVTNSTSFTGDTTNPVVMGRRYTNSTDYPINGFIDDLRITKGVARYTTTFTPPTAAFPNL